MKTTLLALPLFSIFAAASAGAADCLDRFTAEIHHRPLAEKIALAMKLDAKEIECLYLRAGSDPIEPAFFLDEAHRAGKVVQAFAGKNSLPVGKKFEKHFFAGPGATDVYGYNEAPVNHLLHSPGFFRIVPNDADRAAIRFDYREDLVSLLKDVKLAEYRGAKVRVVRNNSGNLIFGGLTDTMKKIDDDVAIGQASKKGKPQSTFIIVRKP